MSSLFDCEECDTYRQQIADLKYRLWKLQQTGEAPHVKQSATSLAAAKQTNQTAKQNRLAILGLFTDRQPSWTCFEIEETLGMLHQTASARVRELVQADAIEFVEGDTRRNPATGAKARIYRRKLL